MSIAGDGPEEIVDAEEYLQPQAPAPAHRPAPLTSKLEKVPGSTPSASSVDNTRGKVFLLQPVVRSSAASSPSSPPCGMPPSSSPQNNSPQSTPHVSVVQRLLLSRASILYKFMLCLNSIGNKCLELLTIQIIRESYILKINLLVPYSVKIDNFCFYRLICLHFLY